MEYDIMIIGGGASGICAAINAKTRNNKILLIERNQRLGKKLLSTGNGKCNLTNSSCRVSSFYKNPEGIYPYFSEGDRAFMENVIGKFDWEDTVKFFNGLGLLLSNKDGYIYPRTMQALTVLEVLENRLKELKIDVLTGYKVRQAKKTGDLFDVDGKYFSKELVIACGGMAAPQTGSDGSGYELASSFGHSLIKPRPALCAISCKGKIFKDIAGVRTDGTVYVYDKNMDLVIKSFGNIQFTEYGLSGIPAFQVSHEVGRLLEEGTVPYMDIDLLPELYPDEIYDLIKDRKENFFLGILNDRLSMACENLLKDSGEEYGSESYKKRLCELAKHFRIVPEGLSPFKNAQITAGGIPTWETDPDTMESYLEKGLYLTGEILDVNGICGGYNLQWAWASGHVCGEALKNIYDKDFSDQIKS